MNDTEKQECQNVLGTSEGVTMEDYFNFISKMANKDVSEIKVQLPSPPTPQSMGDGSGSKEVVRVPVPVGSGGDPYEDLDFFG